MKRTAIAISLFLMTACSTYTTTSDPVYTTAEPAVTTGALVRCESINNTRKTCSVDAAGRMVAVNQLLSDNPCILGRTWGVSSDRREIWVNDGCRAEFQVGGTVLASTAFGRSLICESQNNTRSVCAADTTYGVQLVRQISQNGCNRGTDWGFTENGVWVDNGCRAEFAFGGDQRYQPMTSSARSRVTCESQNNAMNRCSADTYWGVTLARQISDSTCVRGRTWGYDANGIWVTGGCRAEFAVGY